MTLLSYLPLGLVVAVLTVIAGGTISPRIDRTFTRLALNLFRDVVEQWAPKRSERIELLQATHATTTYPVYAARTLFFSLVGGIASFVLSAYAGVALLKLLLAHREAVQAALPSDLQFVINPKPRSNPFHGLGGAGGVAIPLQIPRWLADLIPRPVAEGLGWLWGLIPAGLKSSVSVGGASASGSNVGQVHVLIHFPNLGLLPPTIARLSPVQLALLAVGALWLGGIGAAFVYALRWYDLESRAKERELLIEESFVRTVAFVYALSRSGMLFPEILRTVSRNRQAFGETAEELTVAVKGMDLFGTDAITSLERTARWTPSDQFGEFLKNFTNVLKSGQNVADYLHDRYEQAQRERVENQEQLLEYFTALGEAYVAVLVAGPLFLVAILTILGLLNGGLYRLLQFMIYLAIPGANLAFIGYLGNIGRTLSSMQVPDRTAANTSVLSPRLSQNSVNRSKAVTDGGAVTVEENLRRLRLYDRIRPIRWALNYPLETLTARPVVVLYLAFPVAIIWIVLQWWVHGAGTLPLRTIDDWFVQGALLVTGSFAVVQEYHTRRVRRIEAEVPDFLDSLASTNEAGRTFTESLKRLGSADLGVLDAEFDRLLRDIEWGARTEAALERFSHRIHSPTVARVVALLTNALRASDQIGPVIRIAAEEARKDRSLKRKRRQEMFMYVLIVYVSFIVFLGLTLALKTILVPAVPSAGQLSPPAAGGSFGVKILVNPAMGAMKDKYTLLLFHAALVQAVVSGFVAGKMGEGSVKNGAKHASIMLLVAYGLFILVG